MKENTFSVSTMTQHEHENTYAKEIKEQVSLSRLFEISTVGIFISIGEKIVGCRMELVHF